MSGDARLKILSRVRLAQIRAHIPETKSGLPAQLAQSVMEPAARLRRLLKEFSLLEVEVFVEATEETVRERVRGLIAGQAILSWDPAQLPYGTGTCLDGQKVYYGTDSKDNQGKADIGLTGCESAIAETGTLAMTSGPGRPRSASLMPLIHVVVIRAADIIPGMGEFFRMYREKAISFPCSFRCSFPCRRRARQPSRPPAWRWSACSHPVPGSNPNRLRALIPNGGWCPKPPCLPRSASSSFTAAAWTA